MRNRSHRYDTSRPRPRHRHKYTKYNMCLSTMMNVLSNTETTFGAQFMKKLSNTEVKFKKSLLISKGL